MGWFGDALKSFVNSNPIGQVVGLVSSGITSALNRHQQKEANKANQYQNELNRNFTAEQSQLDRDFNAQQSQQQNVFNAQEAEKSRIFNADQAAQQMDFQEKMWNLQNEYNDPKNQIARLKAAGINPNWSDGFDNTAGSVSGGAAGTSVPAQGSLAHHASVGAPGSLPVNPYSLENPAMTAAQIQLATAQAKKATSEANKSDTEADRIRQLLAGELLIQDSQYRVNLSEVLRNDASAKESLKNVEKLETDRQVAFAKLDEIRQNITNLQTQNKLTEKELDAFETRLGMELYESLSRVKMNGAAATSYLASADASHTQARLNEEQQRLVCKQIIHEGISNDMLKVDFRIKEHTELSSVKLINASNTLRTNDVDMQNADDWRFARLFFGTVGQVLNANLNLSDVTRH